MQSELQRNLSFFVLEIAQIPANSRFSPLRPDWRKCSPRTPAAILPAIFSGGQVGSPVSSFARGEWNTIRKRSIGEGDLTSLSCLWADRFYELERGCVVEFGRHAELLDQKGLYYATWRQQVGEREAVAQGK